MQQHNVADYVDKVKKDMITWDKEIDSRKETNFIYHKLKVQNLKKKF